MSPVTNSPNFQKSDWVTFKSLIDNATSEQLKEGLVWLSSFADTVSETPGVPWGLQTAASWSMAILGHILEGRLDAKGGIEEEKKALVGCSTDLQAAKKLLATLERLNLERDTSRGMMN